MDFVSFAISSVAFLSLGEYIFACSIHCPFVISSCWTPFFSHVTCIMSSLTGPEKESRLCYTVTAFKGNGNTFEGRQIWQNYVPPVYKGFYSKRKESADPMGANSFLLE